MTFLKGWKLPSVALLGIVFALYTTFSRPETPVRTPVTPPPTSPYQGQIGGIGVIEPRSEIIELGMDVSGIVTEIWVEKGMIVQKGDKILTLDSRLIDAEMTVISAKIKETEVALKEAEENFRLVQGLEKTAIISKDDYNHRLFAVQKIKASLNSLQAQRAQTIVQKEKLTLTAPMDGKILDLNIRVGEFIAPTLQNLIKIGDVSTLYIRVEIDEDQAHSISADASAVAVPRGRPDIRYPLRFVRREPLVKPKENLAVLGQRVDTRVTQFLYELPTDIKDVQIGQQIDIFVERKGSS